MYLVFNATVFNATVLNATVLNTIVFNTIVFNAIIAIQSNINAIIENQSGAGRSDSREGMPEQ